MTQLLINAGGFEFIGRLEEEKAPKTCEAFKRMLPLDNQLIHVRWSGEGVWIPYGNLRLDIPYENHTSYPSKGEFLIYPGGISEMEMILAYGKCHFSSQVGQLAGNHFMTIIEGLDNMEKLGKKVLWEGAQPISIKVLA